MQTGPQRRGNIEHDAGPPHSKTLGASKMSRTVEADRIRNDFLEALRAEGASVESMIDRAANASNETTRNLLVALGRAGREVYLVGGVGFINVHVRSEDRGWWGILKTVKKDLDFLANELGLKCYFVLLVGRDDKHIADGYIAADFASSPFLKPPSVDATKYTVNEKQHLIPSKRLLSIGKVAKALMALRRPAVT